MGTVFPNLAWFDPKVPLFEKSSIKILVQLVYDCFNVFTLLKKFYFMPIKISKVQFGSICTFLIILFFGREATRKKWQISPGPGICVHVHINVFSYGIEFLKWLLKQNTDFFACGLARTFYHAQRFICVFFSHFETP